ncbi:MAG: hypothetical protein AAF830_01590 [Pseudomonadota bacterium]
MSLIKASGCVLVLSAWIAGLGLTLQPPGDSAAVSVVFAPWTHPSDQTAALVEADLHLAERNGPWVLTGFRGEGGSVDQVTLRRRGAVLIVSQQNFGLCARQTDTGTARTAARRT